MFSILPRVVFAYMCKRLQWYELIGVNISEHKRVTKRTKKQESTPPCDEMHTKAQSSIFYHRLSAQLVLQYIM